MLIKLSKTHSTEDTRVGADSGFCNGGRSMRKVNGSKLLLSKEDYTIEPILYREVMDQLLMEPERYQSGDCSRCRGNRYRELMKTGG